MTLLRLDIVLAWLAYFTRALLGYRRIILRKVKNNDF